MTFLDTEIKELGRSTQYNTHNTKVFICTLKYVPDIVADGRSLYGFTTHTHTHTHLIKEQIQNNTMKTNRKKYRRNYKNYKYIQSKNSKCEQIKITIEPKE